MAKSIPTAWTDSGLNAGRLTVGEVAVQTDWENVVEMHNYEYAHAGARCIGMIFDGAFTTTSGTYTVTNSTSGGRDLDTWFGLLDPQRPVEGGGLRIRIRAYLQQANCRATLYRMDTGASIGTVTATNSSTAAWAATEVALASTYATIPIGVVVEASATSGTGSIWSFTIQESVITNTSYLPDGS